MVNISPLNLPTDWARQPQSEPRYATHSFQIPAALAGTLRTWAQARQATLHKVWLATLQVLLYRHTQQEDIWIGASLSGQQRNWLAVQSELSGAIDFNTCLQRLDASLMTATPYQHDPAAKERLQVLFQVTPDSHSVFELGLNIPQMQAVDADLSATFTYRVDLFATTSIKRMAGHFLTLLTGIAQNPQQPIAALPLLTIAERQQMLHDWNQTATVYPQQKCLHHLFEEQAIRRPEAIAVISPLADTSATAASLTYQELNTRANQLAQYLSKQGIFPNSGTETLVGVYIDRSVNMMVALLGILKAGGTYVPIDPAYPADRIALILENASPPIIITQSHLLAQLPSHSSSTLCMDTDWAAIATEPDQSPTSAVSPEQLAYVIYTSGSTGKPKGVEIRHYSLVNLMTAMQTTPGMVETDVMLALASFAFDMSIPELYLPLTCGGTLVIAPPKAPADPDLLSGLIAHYGITIMQATPTTWRLLRMIGWQGHPQLKLICGAEAWHQALANELLGCGHSLWNLYGPTETTVWSSYYPLTTTDNTTNTLVPPGYPLANTQFYVVNEYLQPVPVGVVGELLIGGDGLARGYHRQPELSAEKFIPNPFGSSGREHRVYRTGDLARYRADGTLEFLGRMDHQVKIRGFRIELGDIESALTQHPQVREGVVVPQQDAQGETCLVAYVVQRDDALVVEDLRHFLQTQLPHYMIPPFFMVLERFPLTPNGKVNRKALPAPTHAAPVSPLVSASTPANETLSTTQQRLLRLWQPLLGVANVGMDDSFFDLGGHSLIAVELVKQVRHDFQTTLSVSDLFTAPTIRQLSQLIDTQKQTSHHTSNQVTPNVPVGGTPFIYLRKDMAALEQLLGGQFAQCLPSSWQLFGALDVAAFMESLQRNLAILIHCDFHDLSHLDSHLQIAKANHLALTSVVGKTQPHTHAILLKMSGNALLQDTDHTNLVPQTAAYLLLLNLPEQDAAPAIWQAFWMKLLQHYQAATEHQPEH